MGWYPDCSACCRHYAHWTLIDAWNPTLRPNWGCRPCLRARSPRTSTASTPRTCSRNLPCRAAPSSTRRCSTLASCSVESTSCFSCTCRRRRRLSPPLVAAACRRRLSPPLAARGGTSALAVHLRSLVSSRPPQKNGLSIRAFPAPVVVTNYVPTGCAHARITSGTLTTARSRPSPTRRCLSGATGSTPCAAAATSFWTFIRAVKFSALPDPRTRRVLCLC